MVAFIASSLAPARGWQEMASLVKGISLGSTSTADIMALSKYRGYPAGLKASDEVGEAAAGGAAGEAAGRLLDFPEMSLSVNEGIKLKTTKGGAKHAVRDPLNK
jgi:hypothetical protein